MPAKALPGVTPRRTLQPPLLFAGVVVPVVLEEPAELVTGTVGLPVPAVPMTGPVGPVVLLVPAMLLLLVPATLLPVPPRLVVPPMLEEPALLVVPPFENCVVPAMPSVPAVPGWPAVAELSMSSAALQPTKAKPAVNAPSTITLVILFMAKSPCC